MAGEPPNDTMWWSPLEDCPEHVRAIGMISIENANLEYELADLFSRILQIHPRVGRAIYLTPKSAIARIEIFENASKAVLSPKTDSENLAAAFLEKALCIASRARAVVGKRHEIIHDGWGVDSQTGNVLRIPTKRAQAPVPLADLQNLVRDFRLLIYDAARLGR
jgi:hypothetical protein